MNKVTSADGTPIAFERSGEGPAVIVVGGAFNDRGSAGPLMRLLAPRLTVIGYDRRGRGDSGDTPPYEVEREIEDLAALIAEAGGPVSLYGHSSGAVLALRAAAHGLPVSRLALYEPPFEADDDAARRSAREYAAYLAELLSKGDRGGAVALFMTNVGLPPEMVEGARSAPMWPGLEAMAHTLAYDSEVMGHAGSGGTMPAGLVGGLPTPALVLAGEASPARLTDAARRVADTLPEGRLVILAGQTHDVDPEVLAPVLADFFAG
ncbi:alpha/beta fold hydrolase [Actinomadura scrupuli]|uniref:alpha/beta fold hydrolase n=1 Tax=Actinomadura scrupuli TaxID=559629 RepID=UPI003D96FFD8